MMFLFQIINVLYVVIVIGLLRNFVVCVYQFKQCCQYGSENVWVLSARRITKEIRQNQRRYTESKISFENYRKIGGIILAESERGEQVLEDATE